MSDLSYSGNVLFIGREKTEMGHEISDARVVNDRVIVMYDPDSYNSRAVASNIVALSRDDNEGWYIAWEADPPTTKSGDRFMKIVSEEPFVALSFSSFECTIDLVDGTILKKVFVR